MNSDATIMSWAADANLSSGYSAAASEGKMRRWRDIEEKERQEKEKDGKTRFFFLFVEEK